MQETQIKAHTIESVGGNKVGQRYFYSVVYVQMYTQQKKGLGPAIYPLVQTMTFGA
jgi:hypothetical protein